MRRFRPRRSRPPPSPPRRGVPPPPTTAPVADASSFLLPSMLSSCMQQLRTLTRAPPSTSTPPSAGFRMSHPRTCALVAPPCAHTPHTPPLHAARLEHRRAAAVHPHATRVPAARARASAHLRKHTPRGQHARSEPPPPPPHRVARQLAVRRRVGVVPETLRNGRRVPRPTLRRRPPLLGRPPPRTSTPATDAPATLTLVIVTCTEPLARVSIMWLRALSSAHRSRHMARRLCGWLGGPQRMHRQAVHDTALRKHTNHP